VIVQWELMSQIYYIE